MNKRRARSSDNTSGDERTAKKRKGTEEDGVSPKQRESKLGYAEFEKIGSRILRGGTPSRRKIAGAIRALSRGCAGNNGTLSVNALDYYMDKLPRWGTFANRDVRGSHSRVVGYCEQNDAHMEVAADNTRTTETKETTPFKESRDFDGKKSTVPDNNVASSSRSAAVHKAGEGSCINDSRLRNVQGDRGDKKSDEKDLPLLQKELEREFADSESNRLKADNRTNSPSGCLPSMNKAPRITSELSGVRAEDVLENNGSKSVAKDVPRSNGSKSVGEDVPRINASKSVGEDVPISSGTKSLKDDLPKSNGSKSVKEDATKKYGARSMEEDVPKNNCSKPAEEGPSPVRCVLPVTSARNTSDRSNSIPVEIGKGAMPASKGDISHAAYGKDSNEIDHDKSHLKGNSGKESGKEEERTESASKTSKDVVPTSKTRKSPIKRNSKELKNLGVPAQRGHPWPRRTTSVDIEGVDLKCVKSGYMPFLNYPEYMGDDAIRWGIACLTQRTNLPVETEPQESLFVIREPLLISEISGSAAFSIDALGARLGRMLKMNGSLEGKEWLVVPIFEPPPGGRKPPRVGESKKVGHYLFCAIWGMGQVFEFLMEKFNDGCSMDDVDIAKEFSITSPCLLLIESLGSTVSNVSFEKALRFILGFFLKEVSIRNVNHGTRSTRSNGSRPGDQNDPLKQYVNALRRFYASTAVGILGPAQPDFVKCGFYVLAHFFKSRTKGYLQSISEMVCSKHSFPSQDAVRSLLKSANARVPLPVFESLQTKCLFNEKLVETVVNDILVFTSNALSRQH